MFSRDCTALTAGYHFQHLLLRVLLYSISPFPCQPSLCQQPEWWFCKTVGTRISSVEMNTELGIIEDPEIIHTAFDLLLVAFSPEKSQS